MKSITLILTLLSFHLLYSQDTIRFKNGNQIAVKVLEISSRKMSYKRTDNLENGPVYVVSLSTVKNVKYENGTIENFEGVRQEMADLSKRHLLEFNFADLLFSRTSINYEVFLGQKRKWSLFVPFRLTFNQKSHQWNGTPWYEGGIGSKYYMLRRGYFNLAASLETNYAYAQNQTFVQQNGIWETQQLPRHWLIFYGGLDMKVNFRPRIGVNVGFGFGGKFRVSSNESHPQAKVDLGFFFRF